MKSKHKGMLNHSLGNLTTFYHIYGTSIIFSLFINQVSKHTKKKPNKT
jgi:hypothetical protein